MDVFGKVEAAGGHPLFEDRYTDQTHTGLKNSQDVVFCEKCHPAGVPIYCDFDSPAGHQQLSIERLPECAVPASEEIKNLYIRDDDGNQPKARHADRDDRQGRHDQ